MNEIKEKMIQDGKYLVISIDEQGNLFTPSKELNYLGSGIETIYRETIEEIEALVEHQKALNITKKLGLSSPYGNKLCKYN